MIIPFSFFKTISGYIDPTENSSNTTADKKQVFLVIGDSTSAGVNGNTGNGPLPAAGTGYFYKGMVSGIVEFNATNPDIIAAPKGSQWPQFCTSYFNGSGRKAVIVPAGVGGATIVSHPADNNDWSPTGLNYSAATASTANALSILGLTKPKAIFIASLGINDCREAYDGATIQAGIDSLISRLQISYSGVPILIEQIGQDENAVTNGKNKFVKAKWKSICENNTDYYLSNGMISMVGAGMMAGDNIHPTQTGNNVRGEMYARWLLNNTYPKWSRSIISGHFDELSNSRKNAINTLITNNLSDYLQHEVLQVYKTTTVNNTYFDWGFTTSPKNSSSTFSANTCISTNGSTSYFNSGIRPFVSNNKSTQNNGFLALKIKNNNTGASGSNLIPVGAIDTTCGIVISQLAGSVGIGFRYNDIGTITTWTGETVLANNSEYLVGRNGTTKMLYKNGSQVFSATQASIGFELQEIYVGGNNLQGTPSSRIAIDVEYLRAGPFTGITQSSFKTAMDTFLAAW